MILMKKVLLIAPMSSVHERFNRINIEVLKSLGYELHVAANFECGSTEDLRYHARYKNLLEEEGIIVHQIPFFRSSLIKNIKAIQVCKKLFSKECFDMIHVHTETGGFITRIALLHNTQTRLIYTPHGMSFYKGSSLKSWFFYYPIEKWICKRSSANLAMNQEEFAILKNYHSSTAYFVHGVGLDINKISNQQVNLIQKRQELEIPEDAFLILSIGELNKNKNHEIVLRALAKMKDLNWYYLICGEGSLKQHLEAVALSLGVSNQVLLAGYRRDIPQIIKVADLFIFPSFHEGLPVSLMEAMAGGLPIICSKIRGNVDLITEGEGGYLCPPESIEAFYKALVTLRFNKDLIEHMGQNNLNRIQDFTQEKVANELEKIYKEVLYDEEESFN